MRASVATQYYKKLLKHPNDYYKQIAKVMKEEYMAPEQMTTKGPRHWIYLAKALKDCNLLYWATAVETIAEAQTNYTAESNTGEIQLYGGGSTSTKAAEAEIKLLQNNPTIHETWDEVHILAQVLTNKGKKEDLITEGYYMIDFETYKAVMLRALNLKGIESNPTNFARTKMRDYIKAVFKTTLQKTNRPPIDLETVELGYMKSTLEISKKGGKKMQEAMKTTSKEKINKSYKGIYDRMTGNNKPGTRIELDGDDLQ